jgi:hypothetical protein
MVFVTLARALYIQSADERRLRINLLEFKMTKFSRLFRTLVLTVTVAAFTFAFNACSQENPLGSSTCSEVKTEQDYQLIPDLPGLDKQKIVETNKHKYKAHRADVDETSAQRFPLIGTTTINYCEDRGHYREGIIKFGAANNSKFTLDDNALTPPPGYNVGDSVTITMRIDYDKDNKESIYSFGPHGCQFSPQAQLKLDYGALGLEMPKLYYINDDGNRVEQEPEQISVNKKWLKIRVDHFSRYAVSWAE